MVVFGGFAGAAVGGHRGRAGPVELCFFSPLALALTPAPGVVHRDLLRARLDFGERGGGVGVGECVADHAYDASCC